mgnify:CR=1 FL=1
MGDLLDVANEKALINKALDVLKPICYEAFHCINYPLTKRLDSAIYHLYLQLSSVNLADLPNTVQSVSQKLIDAELVTVERSSGKTYIWINNPEYLKVKREAHQR